VWIPHHKRIAKLQMDGMCDTGICIVTGVWRESKVIRLLSIIHNGIILDLVCGCGVVSVVVLVRMFVLIFPVEARNLFLFVVISHSLLSHGGQAWTCPYILLSLEASA